MQILNLGCGSRTSQSCVNIDWSVYLRMKKSRTGRLVARAWLRGVRWEAFRSLDDRIVVHDLTRGIPAADGSTAAVYHSHVLEHIDREAVPAFFAETLRVLAPGGVHRIVVPDLEPLGRRYVEHLALVDSGSSSAAEHDQTIAAMIEQMARREAHGTSRQPRPKQLVENLLLGDARNRGETHRWMYDRVNLSHALREAGYHTINVVDYLTSDIAGWEMIALDQKSAGGEYKPGSLYVEAIK